MAAGGRSSGGNAVDAAERLHRLAEQRFLAGDVAGALRAAREAQARSRGSRTPSPPTRSTPPRPPPAPAGSGRNWYAVLGVGARTSLPTGGVGVSHEDIKRRYRRLCLVLHPDKNRSAAADGAFKLLQQAWGTLSARHPPAAPAPGPTGGGVKLRSAPTPSPRPRPPAPPAPAAKPSNHSRPPPPAASPANNAPRDDKRRAGATHSRPPPPAERASADTRHTPASSAKPGNHSRPPPPAASAAYTPKGEGSGTDTPPRRQGNRNSRRFPCPAQCVHCGAPFASSRVSVGTWHLHCAACHRYAKVCVRSPSNAEICR